MSSKGKRKLGQMSVDDFMKDGFNESDDEEKPKETLKSSSEKQNGRKETRTVKKTKKETEENDVNESKQHKRALHNLKDSDPEFYKYLQTNDENLLNFNASDSSDDEEDARKQKKKHTNDEAKSDDDDDDEEEEEDRRKGGSVVVSMKMINAWTTRLRSNDVNTKTLKEVIEVFHAAVLQVQGHLDDGAERSSYLVEDGAMFNAIMRMCVVHLLPAMNRILKGEQKPVDQEKPLSSYKHWTKIQSCVKNYLRSLLKVLLVVAEPTIVSVLLKHVVQLVPYITAEVKFAKGYLKKLIYFWCSGEEVVRVLAFIAIVKITRALASQLYEYVLKTMYMSYVRNAKFTSPSTWPMINFMKRSLVEVFALDMSQAYQYAFVYIRQLSIHLRNAITGKQKDSMKTVYNWQYVHCLHFLAQLLATLDSKETLRPLIYPLVQTIMGTIKLIPTARFFPLRFHCVRILILLSRDTQTFIPVLPLLMEVLETTDFNKKHQRSSFKPLDFSCMLKLSKVQLVEQGFKDGLLDQVYELVMEYLSYESHSIGYPELVLPTILQLKAFLKKCKVGNYSKVVKQLLEKIEENSKVVCDNRKNVTLNLNDSNAIDAFEVQLKLSGTPMIRYYEQYKKLREREMAREISQKEKIVADRFNMPEVNRKKLAEQHKQKTKVDLKNIFNVVDDESDDDFFSKKVNEIDQDSDENED